MARASSRTPAAAPAPAAPDLRRFPASRPPAETPGGGAADLVVEVEFATPSQALTAQAAFGAARAADAAAPSAADPGWNGVLARWGVQQVAPVFDAERQRSEEAALQQLRAQAALNASAAGTLDRLERLPSPASFVRLRFPPGTPPEAVVRELRALPGIARAVAVPREAPPDAALPDDPLIGTPDGPLLADPQSGLESQWYLHRLRVPAAWRLSRGDGVVIADIDWGFRVSHAEFAAAIEKTHNARDGSSDVTQGASASHGTAVLGLAGARADGSGICGCAPAAALWAIKADGGPALGETWAEAIDFVRLADSQGRRKVIVLEVQTSVGGNYEQVPSVHRAVRAAIAAGCVVCVAAGNGGRRADLGDDGQPFDPTGSILVGATAFDAVKNRRADFSNFGPRVVVSAPGDPLHDLTCGQGGDHEYRNDFGGTSGATPKVAGIVALMLAANPALSHDEVRDILVGTGSAVEEDPGRPIGVFADARAAVMEALRRGGQPVPNSPSSVPAGPLPRRRLQGTHRRSTALEPDEAQPRAPDPAAAFAGATPVQAQVDRTLRVFRETVTGTLTQADRIRIVEQAILMLDNFYVHRLLKESIHAVRPVQRLRVWLRRLQQSTEIPAAERDELGFHNTLTQAFNSVRDLHTGYQLPRPYSDYIAYLPFEVAAFQENGRARYMVTRVLPGQAFADAGFAAGAELLSWNGMTLERAVLADGEQTAGSNDAARRARGLSALTIRAMNTTLPPLADRVDIEFVPAGADPDDPAARRNLRQDWLVRFAPQGGAAQASSATAPAAPAAAAAAAARVEGLAGGVLQFAGDTGRTGLPALAQRAALAVDAAADAVREARQLIFDAEALRALENADDGEERVGLAGTGQAAGTAPAAGEREVPVRVPWNLTLRARELTLGGRTLGHIQIGTFNVDDADGFVQEFVRLLRRMPEGGLVLDVRGNGGGSIWAAERLLQTLTPVEIEPERMQFIATPGTRDLCRHNADNRIVPLEEWRASLDEAVETGSVYSRGFAVTAAATCNTLGQQYYGPVVLLVDGTCYSATDMFAAGFQDHGIGPILGVAQATGAGGANVWDHRLLSQLLPDGWGLKPLPAGANLRVAIRQSLRVGPRSGALLEDFGVAPDRVLPLRRADLLEHERELLAAAASMLAERQLRSIAVTPLALAPSGRRELRVETRGLARLDFFVDERPSASEDLQPDGTGRAVLTPRVPPGALLRLVGFAQAGDTRAAATWRGQV